MNTNICELESGGRFGRLSRLVLGAAALIAVSITPALAQEQRTTRVTLRVPVQLENVHEAVTEALVRCRLFIGLNRRVTEETAVPLRPGGLYQGVVEVVFNDPDEGFPLPHRYQCDLYFRSGGDESHAGGGGFPVWARTAGAPIGTYSLGVVGDVPAQ